MQRESTCPLCEEQREAPVGMAGCLSLAHGGRSGRPWCCGTVCKSPSLETVYEIAPSSRQLRSSTRQQEATEGQRQSLERVSSVVNYLLAELLTTRAQQQLAADVASDA